MSSLVIPRPRTSAATYAGISCLFGIAVTHLADLPDKLEEAHYMAGLFICLIVGSLVVAVALAASIVPTTAWAVGAILAVFTIVGYVLSRSVGLPQIEDHVGMWWDPWGVASIVCEAGFVALAVRQLRDAD